MLFYVGKTLLDVFDLLSCYDFKYSAVYVLFYCSTATADNIFLHGLLIHVKLENSFYEFLSELKSVFSKCCDVNSPSMSTSWKKRITNALLQMCRSYRLLSFKQRMQLLRSCEDFLFEAKDTLYSYTIVNPETQPKEVVPNHILPQWGLQENKYAINVIFFTHFSQTI